MSSNEPSFLGKPSATPPTGWDRKVYLRLICVLIPAIAILSFLPTHDKVRLHTEGRFHSVGHVLAFGAVAYLAARSARSTIARTLLFLGSLAFGLVMEYGEHVIFHNSLERKDIIVDALGVIAGTLVAMSTAQQETNKPANPVSQEK